MPCDVLRSGPAHNAPVTQSVGMQLIGEKNKLEETGQTTERLVKVGKWGNSLVQANVATEPIERRSAAAPDSASPTRQEIRSRENRQCIGGMRNPRQACRKLPKLRSAGRKVRKCIESFMAEENSVIDLLSLLGSSELEDSSSELSKRLSALREKLAGRILNAFGRSASSRRAAPCTIWNAELAEAFAVEADDPDKEFISWLWRGCPVGVACPVPPGGVFPRVESTQAATDEIRKSMTRSAPWSNYSSVVDEPELSAAEVDRLIDKGFAKLYHSWDEVMADFESVLVSKLAVIVKEREDGTQKVRLVLDLRRSGYNNVVKCEERIVLPRLKDLVDEALSLMEENSATDSSVFLLIADFEDAFHSLGLAESEYQYLFAKHPSNGYVSFRTVLCGGAACPLVWGRGAAFLGRSGAALFEESEARLQVYVDDPAALLAGPRAKAEHHARVLLWWWLALGIRVSWKKAKFQQRAKWIGADVDLTGSDRVTVTIPDDFCNKVVTDIDETLKHLSVPVTKLRKLAGKVGWAASISAVLWSHVAPLWAASADAGTSHRSSSGTVAVARVRHALVWQKALFQYGGHALAKTFHLGAKWALPRVHIYIDASPWGYGAFLTWDSAPVEYLAGGWTEDDLSRFSLTLGDARGQAVLGSSLGLPVVPSDL